MEPYARIIERKIDVVFCIDKTGSMDTFIDRFRNDIELIVKSIYDLYEIKDHSLIKSLRFKFIAFGDYEYDTTPMIASDFFAIPQQLNEMKVFLNKIHGEGGGDIPENGLEALYLAFHSDFEIQKGGRQFIILFTDADALHLGERSDVLDYPFADIDESTLENDWGGLNPTSIDQRNKRLIIYCPKDSRYRSLNFDNAYFRDAEEYGEDSISGIDFSTIITKETF